MKKFLLSLSVAMLSVVGAWAQDFSWHTADAEGASLRRIEITLSGDWLNGPKAEEYTTALIDIVMGYVATPKLDGDGKPIYKQAVDENGDPLFDSDNNPVYVQDVDENGDPLVDADNNPVYVQEYNDPAFHPEKAFTEVTIKSASGTVTINNRLLQQLVTGKVTEAEGHLTWHTSENKVTRLDLSGVAVTGYVGNTGSADRAADAICPANESPVTYFAMPSFEVRADQTYTIPSYVLNGMTLMDELILPANTKKVGTAAFAALNYNKFKLNPGLEFIGNSAFHAASDRKGMETLDIPSSVKYIGPDAFWFRSFTDIYFHSAQAPICPVGYGVIEKADHAMLYNDCYMGNNGFTDSNEHAESQTSGVYPMGRDGGKPGKANRENYMSEGKRWMVMVHFPSSAEMAAEGKTLDIASYKDVTRVYNKIYGTIYGPRTDASEIETAIPGHEQEYIKREKIWDEANSFDYVGKETTPLTYGTVTAAKDVNSGYEDTYRGLNYIWPSQSQWVRAFNTVALGYNWDGVTEYRPTLTPEQIALMVEDGLQVNMKQDGSGSGQWVAVGEDITYDEAKANEYNAGLEGAVHAGEAKAWYTAEEAIEFNATLDDAVDEGDSKGEYTAEEAIAHNESLPTAIHEGGVKEQWTAEDAAANNEGLDGAWHENDPIYPTAQEVLDHNADFDGAKHEGDVLEEGWDEEIYTWAEYYANAEAVGKGWITNSGASETAYNDPQNRQNWKDWWGLEYVKKAGKPTTYYTAEQAAAYNAANHPNPWTESTVIGNVTAEQAIAHNATLPNAVKEGDTKSTYTAEEALAWNSDPEKNPGCVVAGQSKGVYTADEAIAYNATLPNAKHEGDEKDWWSAEDAIAENKKLPGAREAGYTSKSYDDPAIADLLSWVAFQSTRRCVFGANDGGGDDYDPKVPSSEAWWTICLPFDLTKAQIDKYFGEGTHVCLFNKVDRNINPGEGKNPYIKFYFTSDQYVGKTDDQVVLKAHVPYMIYPTIKGGEGTAVAVGKIPASEYYKKTGNPIPTEITANDGEEYRFIGNYDTMLPVQNADGSVSTTPVVIPQYSYFYAKKKGDAAYKFWFVQNTNMKWAANKCVIQSTSADRGLADQDTFFSEAAKQANGTEAKQITILGDEIDESDAEATAIDVIIIAGDGENSEVIYNLNGQVLNVAPQHGIYIKNGKKYIAK